MNWTKLFEEEVTNGPDFVMSVEVSGKKLCAVKSEGEIYVVERKCPHAGADLSSGWCSNGNLVCPYHRHEFDLKTGRGKKGQGNYVKTYAVEHRKDGIYVGVPKNFWKFW